MKNKLLYVLLGLFVLSITSCEDEDKIKFKLEDLDKGAIPNFTTTANDDGFVNLTDLDNVNLEFVIDLTNEALQGDDGLTQGSGRLDPSLEFADVASIDVTAPGGATAALADIDAALDNVTAQMTEYGAQENALESMAEFNSVKQEAAMASRSRIMDTDFASGMSEFQNAKVQAKLAATLNGFNSDLVLRLLPGK